MSVAVVKKRNPIAKARAPSIRSVNHGLNAAQRKQIRSILSLGNIQAKLTIGQPNDKYEQEADQVADRVMPMPDPTVQRVENRDDEEQVQAKPLADQITPMVHRQEESPEEEEVQAKFNDGEIAQRQLEEEEEETAQARPIQRQAEEEEETAQTKLIQRQPEEEEEAVQAKSETGSPASVSSRTESNINSMKGGGRPLDAATRSYFEPRFGTDFSNVRVYHDARAAETAKSIQARAFTVGNNIAFGSGEYSPASSEGKRLLAHELTHTLQQTSAPKAKVQRAPVKRHDLSSRLFFGDARLEAVYDKTRTIRNGSKGGYVKKLQQALINLGYPLPKYGKDGMFGGETERAVRAYQNADSGLSEDGVVGANTITSLDNRLFSNTAAKYKADVDVQEYGAEKKAEVEKAMVVAYEMTDRAQKNIGAGGGNLYKKWFDFHHVPGNKVSARRFKKLKWKWIKLISVFKSKEVEIEHMDPDQVIKGKSYSSLYAYVKTKDGKYHIWLGGAFWKAPLRGMDSRGGTLVHELSHEEVGTDDHKYGAAKAEALAKSDPDKAVANADNWEYFSENS